jgi:hypothetical protein
MLPQKDVEGQSNKARQLLRERVQSLILHLDFWARTNRRCTLSDTNQASIIETGEKV